MKIKIWFQNRRTKWKRKYTSELEIAAQQYYSAMGLASPRPMVLGDRLWLFPNGPFIPPTPLNMPFNPNSSMNNPNHTHSPL
ncbi:Homeobox protein HMX2 [Orchesella cincta]|uniref:Homeobox protein HMX2 n=1 Tax=Orchesella cincta TaxID=48709 RepID=A0A1D2MWG3_ORCCI|nr:Homeobox protein HMX2 [Orchesella cincta]